MSNLAKFDEVKAGHVVEGFMELDLVSSACVLRVATDLMLSDLAVDPRSYSESLDALRDCALSALEELAQLRPDDEDLESGIVRLLTGNQGAAIVRRCGCGYARKWSIDDALEHAASTCCDGGEDVPTKTATASGEADE